MMALRMRNLVSQKKGKKMSRKVNRGRRRRMNGDWTLILIVTLKIHHQRRKITKRSLKIK